MKDRGEKRGSPSVDLPARASSSSVARFFLLGADQRSTLRGAPSPICGGYSAVRPFSDRARPAGAPTEKTIRLGLPIQLTTKPYVSQPPFLSMSISVHPWLFPLPSPFAP